MSERLTAAEMAKARETIGICERLRGAERTSEARYARCTEEAEAQWARILGHIAALEAERDAWRDQWHQLSQDMAKQLGQHFDREAYERAVHADMAGETSA